MPTKEDLLNAKKAYILENFDSYVELDGLKENNPDKYKQLMASIPQLTEEELNDFCDEIREYASDDEIWDWHVNYEDELKKSYEKNPIHIKAVRELYAKEMGESIEEVNKLNLPQLFDWFHEWEAEQTEATLKQLAEDEEKIRLQEEEDRLAQEREFTWDELQTLSNEFTWYVGEKYGLGQFSSDPDKNIRDIQNFLSEKNDYKSGRQMAQLYEEELAAARREYVIQGIKDGSFDINLPDYIIEESFEKSNDEEFKDIIISESIEEALDKFGEASILKWYSNYKKTQQLGEVQAEAHKQILEDLQTEEQYPESEFDLDPDVPDITNHDLVIDLMGEKLADDWEEEQIRKANALKEKLKAKEEENEEDELDEEDKEADKKEEEIPENEINEPEETDPNLESYNLQENNEPETEEEIPEEIEIEEDEEPAPEEEYSESEFVDDPDLPDTSDPELVNKIIAENLKDQQAQKEAEKKLQEEEATVLEEQAKEEPKEESEVLKEEEKIEKDPEKKEEKLAVQQPEEIEEEIPEEIEIEQDEEPKQEEKKEEATVLEEPVPENKEKVDAVILEEPAKEEPKEEATVLEEPEFDGPEIDLKKFGAVLNKMTKDLDSTTGFFTRDSDEFKGLLGYMKAVGDFTKLDKREMQEAMNAIGALTESYQDHMKAKPIDNSRRLNRAGIADKLSCIVQDYRSNNSKKFVDSIIERDKCMDMLKTEMEKKTGFDIPGIKKNVSKLMIMNVLDAKSHEKQQLGSYDEKAVEAWADKLAKTDTIANMVKNPNNLKALISDYKENPGLLHTKAESKISAEMLNTMYKEAGIDKKLADKIETKKEIKNDAPVNNM